MGRPKLTTKRPRAPKLTGSAVAQALLARRPMFGLDGQLANSFETQEPEKC